ncbi:CBS domain-containing protein [Falsiroseomonas oryziterrae]|uniref:CBS domain-containing protein n=1 Tax=Falsiroseomonas oryziterrae TaxID=2911368 RepID=UPI001F43ECFD|nr:CBS domain-containing protein [Roseomonas sp. NPKOSM-4]
MRARDLMTTNLVTIPPTTPLSVVASTLAERGFSGVPVVDAEGRLLGIVTEGDLIRRLAAVEDKRSWLREFFAPAGRQAADYARSHGRTAQDAMTTALVTAEEDTPVERIAKAMEDRGIRRVPVVRDGKLVGIVSRADLIRALMAPAETLAADAPDERIRREVLKAMREQPWVDAYFIFPDVQDGVVLFHGYCRNEDVKRALRVLAEGIPGVKDVKVMVEKAPLPVVMP